MSTGIILFAHGARDPDWARPVERLKALLAERMPAASIEIAFLEHMTPSLEDAAARLVARRISELTIVPVFLAQGSHLSEDLPRRAEMLRERFPALPVRIAPPIGEVDTILVAICGWIEALHGG